MPSDADHRHANVLRTERLGLRRYTPDDVDALRPVFADPEAARFYPAMNTTAALAKWIDWNLRNYAQFGFGLWAVELLDTGRFIGDAGLTYQRPEGEPVLELGWHVHPHFRRRGYATEAALACRQFAFGELQAGSLCSIVDPANAASIKVAKRVHDGHRSYTGRNGPMLLFSSVPVR